MAFESSPVLDFSYPAAEDLSSYQYHFVKVDTSGKVRLLDSALETPDGVLQNAPASGEEATVRMLGISKVVANAALDEGYDVVPEYVGTTDCGKAADGRYGGVICGRVVCASSAEDDLVSVFLTFPKPQLKATVTTVATAGAGTYTAAAMIGGLILRDPAGGARTDTTATAVQIIAEMAKYGISDFEYTVRNTADANETITVDGGTDVTDSGTMTIAQNASKTFKVVKTSATEITQYSIGTFVH
jgi:hypothetical protein